MDAYWESGDRAALEVVASGRVQGVGFRQFTMQYARLYGVSGYVANQRDGSVRAYLVGSDTSVRQLLDAMREGPVMARVDRLETTEVPLDADYKSFVIRE